MRPPSSRRSRPSSSALVGCSSSWAYCSRSCSVIESHAGRAAPSSRRRAVAFELFGAGSGHSSRSGAGAPTCRSHRTATGGGRRLGVEAGEHRALVRAGLDASRAGNRGGWRAAFTERLASVTEDDIESGLDSVTTALFGPAQRAEVPVTGATAWGQRYLDALASEPAKGQVPGSQVGGRCLPALTSEGDAVRVCGSRPTGCTRPSRGSRPAGRSSTAVVLASSVSSDA